MKDGLSYTVGIDLGQPSEFTAIAVLEAKTYPYLRTDEIRERRWITYQPIFRAPDGTETHRAPPPVFALRHLERLSPGTAYSRAVERARALKGSLGKAQLVLDGTGVGEAVLALFRDLGPRKIFLTDGGTVTEEGDVTRVPKRDVASAAQVALQSGHLKVARDLRHAELLVRELLSFRVKASGTSGGDQYAAWREGANDDLVLALAVAVWYAGKNSGIPSPIMVGLLESAGWGRF